MKILTAEQIRKADAYTIEHKPIASINLMERAAESCVNWISRNINYKRKVKIFCGLGNNGGDGLAIGRIIWLSPSHYDVVVYILRHSEKTSNDFQINETRYKKSKERIIVDVHSIVDMPELKDDDVIIDAIFGSGLSKPVEGFLAEVIKKINQYKGFKISIDLPSGLFSEDNSANNTKAIVQVDVTLTFQVPKLSFMLPENYKYTGDWVLLDIGLDQKFIESLDSPYYFVEEKDVKPFLKTRGKYAHKGDFGHGLLIAGSYGKMGAAVLGSKAALRSGAGLITVHIPQKGYQIMQTSVPEAMVCIDAANDFSASLPDISKYNAIAIGPGIDKKEETQKMLKLLIQNSSIPLILDADALNIIAENKTWLSFLPKGSILTPHPKEFERLAGKPVSDFHRLQMQKELSIKFGIYIILKGAHTCISTPAGHFFFNSTGNPGMATGGSGDVLTGILLGLKACGYSSFETCLIGVYLHGLAGDLARKKHGEEALIAGDIIDNINEAFQVLHGQN